MSNVLFALANIVNSSTRKVAGFTKSKNRINSVGEGLESFIKDAFSDSLNVSDASTKLENYNRYFSYLGNKNNPPDLMIKKGDAVEVKKIQSLRSGIALNSSYPKDKLFSTSSLITTACKKAEQWKEKDIIYSIGSVKNGKLNQLWMVYGDVYAAAPQTYERIKDTITKELRSNSNIEFTQTNEIAKIKKVDPLGITDLRVRGMWHIKHPVNVFSYVFDKIDKDYFNVVVIMKDGKYDSMPDDDRETILKLEGRKLKIMDIKVKDPNNPVKLINAKLLLAKL